MNQRQKAIILTPLNILYSWHPELALRILFRMKTGYALNIECPKTFSEKLQWMKLYDRNPLLTSLTDKYMVREYVNQRVPDILTKLYWQGFDAKEIPWDELPQSFVMKATHGCGYVLFCQDKNTIERQEAEKKLNAWLNQKYIKCYGEWFYGIERPRIIIEEFLADQTGVIPNDYKLFCFNGEPKYITVDTGRFTCHKKNVYDTDWNIQKGVTLDFPNDKQMERPKQLEEMIRVSRKLAAGFPFVRIDLYEIQGKVFFGEMTFTPGAGFDRILPFSFDEKMGGLLMLPDKRSIPRKSHGFCKESGSEK